MPFSLRDDVQSRRQALDLAQQLQSSARSYFGYELNNSNVRIYPSEGMTTSAIAQQPRELLHMHYHHQSLLDESCNPQYLAERSSEIAETKDLSICIGIPAYPCSTLSIHVPHSVMPSHGPESQGFLPKGQDIEFKQAADLWQRTTMSEHEASYANTHISTGTWNSKCGTAGRNPQTILVDHANHSSGHEKHLSRTCSSRRNKNLATSKRGRSQVSSLGFPVDDTLTASYHEHYEQMATQTTSLHSDIQRNSELLSWQQCCEVVIPEVEYNLHLRVDKASACMVKPSNFSGTELVDSAVAISQDDGMAFPFLDDFVSSFPGPSQQQYAEARVSSQELSGRDLSEDITKSTSGAVHELRKTMISEMEAQIAAEKKAAEERLQMLLAQKASFGVKFEEQLLEIDKCKSLDNFDKGMPGKNLKVGTAKGSTGNGACSKNLAICTQPVVGLQDDNWMKLKSDECAQEILNMLPDYGMSSCNPKYKEELEQSNRNRKIQQEDLLAMDKKLCATSKGYIELISSSNVGWPTDDLNFNRHFPNKFELDKHQIAAMPPIIHLNNQMQQNLICEQAEEVRLQWLHDERARIPTRSSAKDNSNSNWLDLQVQLPHAAEMSKHVLVKIEELKRGADKIIINAGKKKGELDSHQVERELLKKKAEKESLSDQLRDRAIFQARLEEELKQGKLIRQRLQQLKLSNQDIEGTKKCQHATEVMDCTHLNFKRSHPGAQPQQAVHDEAKFQALLHYSASNILPTLGMSRHPTVEQVSLQEGEPHGKQLLKKISPLPLLYNDGLDKPNIMYLNGGGGREVDQEWLDGERLSTPMLDDKEKSLQSLPAPKYGSAQNKQKNVETSSSSFNMQQGMWALAPNLGTKVQSESSDSWSSDIEDDGMLPLVDCPAFTWDMEKFAVQTHCENENNNLCQELVERMEENRSDRTARAGVQEALHVFVGEDSSGNMSVSDGSDDASSSSSSWWLNGTRLELEQEKKLGNHAFTRKQQVAYKNTKETDVDDVYGRQMLPEHSRVSMPQAEQERYHHHHEQSSTNMKAANCIGLTSHNGFTVSEQSKASIGEVHSTSASQRQQPQNTRDHCELKEKTAARSPEIRLKLKEQHENSGHEMLLRCHDTRGQGKIQSDVQML